MARVVVLYKIPKDAAAFDKHYREVHVPLAKKIPGMRRFETNQGPIATPGGPSNIHLIAVLHFDDMAAVQRAFASPEGQAAGADAQSIATGGVEMLLFENRDV